jgi:hypothetical protein
VHFPVRELRVNFARHHDHVARDLFLRICIACKIALHVTVSTLHSKRNAERPHVRHYLGWFEEFQIFGRRRLPAAAFRGRLLLRKNRQQQEREYE